MGQNPIIVTGFEAASNADMLTGTRVAAAPYNAKYTFILQAADNVAANHFTVTIALPGGDVPLDGVLIPAGTIAGLGGVLDDRTSTMISFAIQAGGNVLFSCVETGDTELTWLLRVAPL